MDDRDKIIDELKAELAKAEERERDYHDARAAMLYMLEDINKTTEAVTTGERIWETTFDSITDPLFIHDAEHKIIRANKAYAKIAGESFKDFIGKPYNTVFPITEKPSSICLKSRETGTEAEEEIAVPSTGRMYRMKYYTIRGASGRGVNSLHIFDDITDAKAAEQRLKDEINITTNLLRIAETTARVKDVDKLMDVVVTTVIKIFHADVCLAYLREPENSGFHPSQASGLEKTALPFFRTETLSKTDWFIKSACESTEALVLNAPFDAQTGKNLPFDWAGPISTILVIPLKSRAGCIGLLIAIYRNCRVLSESETRIARGFMHQISVFLEDAQLYRDSENRSIELSHKIETIKVMHEIDRNMLSTLNASEILDIVVRLTAKLVPCDRATVAMVDRQRNGFVYCAGFGINLAKGVLTPFNETSASKVVETGRAEFIANLPETVALLPLEERLCKEGFMSHIRLPIVVKGEVNAILTVGAKRTGVFTKETLATLENLASQIGVALENARLVTDLQELFLSTIKTLSNTIDAKSPWTMGHSERVTAAAVKIARAMGMQDDGIKTIELAGLLHDIGKLGTYEEILNKPGKLNDEEAAIMREHPGKGALILEPIRQLKGIIPAIKYHHEYYNGTGYPEGLKGAEIPLMARILTVADSVDAMSADRPYRKGRAMDAIVAELKRCSGTQFDPIVVEAFLSTLAST